METETSRRRFLGSLGLLGFATAGLPWIKVAERGRRSQQSVSNKSPTSYESPLEQFKKIPIVDLSSQSPFNTIRLFNAVKKDGVDLNRYF